jgi:hypothetical protein
MTPSKPRRRKGGPPAPLVSPDVLAGQPGALAAAVAHQRRLWEDAVACGPVELALRRRRRLQELRAAMTTPTRPDRDAGRPGHRFPRRPPPVPHEPAGHPVEPRRPRDVDGR